MFSQNDDLLDKLIPDFEDPNCVKIDLKKPEFEAVYYELLKREKSFSVIDKTKQFYYKGTLVQKVD